MPSARRTFLAGAAAALAGCVSGRRDPETSDDTPAPTTTEPSTDATLDFGETATVGDRSVQPTDATVQHSYVVLVYPDFADVVTADGGQFLFLTVDVGGTADAPAPSDFRVATDGASYEGRNRGESGYPYRDGAAYTRDAGHGWILYDVPSPVESERVALELDVGEDERAAWRLPDDVVARLRGPPPAFEVRDFSAPDSVRPDEPIEVSATIANVGEGPGTFRGSLNQEGDALYGADPFSFALDAGAEREWTGTVTTHQRIDLDSQLTVRLRFRSAGGDFDRNVVVRPPGTTTA